MTKTKEDPSNAPVQAMRTQNDGLNDYWSNRSGLICPPEEDRTRHEQAADTDINTLLQRYGLGAPQKALEFGHANYDLDRLGAYAAIDDLRAAWTRLPEHARERYPNPTALLAAVADGSLNLSAPPPAKPVEEKPAP